MTYLNTSQSQSRDDEIQRTGKKPALNDFLSQGKLLEQVLLPENLQKAWKRVRSNKGAPGIDGTTIEQFPDFIKEYGQIILTQLRDGTYQPTAVRRATIRKPDGGERLLGIPIILDRWIMQAIAQILSSMYEPGFSEFSYGFRPGRSQHMAIEQVRKSISKGRKIAVDVDLSKFFDRVDHDYLMSKLGLNIKDKSLMQLLGKYLRAGIMDSDGQYFESRIGVPQGSPLSPLLSNIVLDELDKELERRGHHFARYADDFIILVRSQRAGKRVLDNVTQYVQKQLKLKMNEQKSQVVPIAQSKFLGFSFKGKWLVWHPKALSQFQWNIRRLTKRTKGISMKIRIKELNQYLTGWIHYFGIANQYQLCVELDSWIRRRIRQCYWKQWRKVKTKVRNLLKLGVKQKLAVFCGMSSKSYWHSSKTEGINKGLSNKYLKDLGLVSLKEKWVVIHYG
ncbi:MAG: group II intron reverse transcriptase/maturase [Candidatus Thiodiazotropha sp. (ex Lucinoma borealis)]|nr:group II intron reverse transcriptase/maturase [Candidatus Thiodiazotropha sp. (ex Lucinoma borealis)]